MSSIGIGSGRKRRIDRCVNIASPSGIDSRLWSMSSPSRWATAAQRSRGLEPYAEVIVLRQRDNVFTTRLDAELDETVQRLPARPCVLVGECVFEQRAQRGSIRI